MKNKKRLFTLLLSSLLLSACLISCGDDNTDPADTTSSLDDLIPDQVTTASDETTASDPSDDIKNDLYFSVGDITLIPGTVFADADKLGTPTDFSEAPSCYADGNDKIYTYTDFAVYTYPDGDKDILSIVELFGSSVSTPKGAKVGMTLDEITALYGKDYKEEGSTIVYEIDGISLSFSLTDSSVTLIEYYCD